MKIATWITISDLIEIQHTNLEQVIELFDKKAQIYRNNTYQYVFNAFKKSGIQGLEVLIPYYTTEQDIKVFISKLNECNMPALSIHQSLSNNKVFTLSDVTKLSKIANLLSAKVIVLHSNTLKERLWDKSFIHNLKLLEKKYEITFGVENVSKNPIKAEPYTYKTQQFSQLLNQADLSITFDTTHLGQSGEDIIAFYNKNKTKIVNIHLSDYKSSIINKYLVTQFKTHLPLQTGELPIHDLLIHLKKSHYDKLITLEINAGLKEVCDSASYISNVLKKYE